MIFSLRLFKVFWLGLLLLALLGLHWLSSPPAARAAPDGFRPPDTVPAPVAVPAPAVRLARQLRLYDELRSSSTSGAPNLARKALPRSRWHQAPCSAACLFSPPVPGSYARKSVPG